jgi:ribosomal protein S18 acetylase RimI-like enzyme
VVAAPPGARSTVTAAHCAGSPALLSWFARLGAAAAATAPRESCWYLEALGVHPRVQRRGWGRRVLEPGLRRADDAGLPCYVETSDPGNRGFYVSLGFEVSAPHLEHLPGGPGYIGMRRAPKH